jgi:uncharacterized membrane protein
MDTRPNADETPQPVPVGGGVYTCSLILTVLIALSMAVMTTLLLAILKHNAGFAALSGLFTAILYGVRVSFKFPRLRTPIVPRVPRQQTERYPIEEGSQAARVSRRRMNVLSVLSGLLIVSALVGLYFLPDQQLIFAVLSAVFALLLFHGLFFVCLLVPLRLLAYKGYLSTDEEGQWHWYFDF